MKTHRLLAILTACISAQPVCMAATLIETFEAGEDTSTWNSTWTGGSTVPTFLDESLGGENAGGGNSLSQSFSRPFKNNTAGLSVTTAYSVSMYVQVDLFDGPAGGLFEIVEGSYGSGNAANLRIFTEESSPGVFEFHWQARDNSSGWQDLGIDMDLSSPYRVTLNIDPDTFSYSALVESVDTAGNVLGSGALSGLAFDQNVINNGQNGNLLFYIQASAGGTSAMVDNINIQSVPEPSPAFVLVPAIFLLTLRRRA
ncbi:hypothetical protein JIN84_11270 [Luteolibacter yonseiensis]|uniref:PEP-CTERM protein-sorting domain-containing protein n=1 Tax=Luteolibacter yonseiensis TaxID=1144680 RepID=A0A934R556_9BACT|nr:hypothetical protein [Luteolibacter yonseiensis]MBK1816193.1 hypothetical protein [Luteolibacter yonseiensis]